MDKKSRDIFYGVVIIATLIIALIGTTFSFFSSRTSSGDNGIQAKSTDINIVYNDGDQVTAQADKLIPSSLDVVKRVYQNYIANNGTDSSTKNACIDSNNRQVCSVYRFSVKSNININAYAILDTEYNGFKYLAYAVKDVTNDTWLTLNSNNRQYVDLTSCSNNNNNSNDDCYKLNSENKVYNIYNSIFGYNNNGNMKTQKITSSEHVYDLILFVHENNKDQNIDQGKKYQGTIKIEATDDINRILSGKN